MPSWAYRRARSSGRNPNPVLVHGSRAVQISKQMKEQMLCDACEQRLGRDENYASTLAYQVDDTATLFDKVERAYVDGTIQTTIAKPVDLDVEALVRFGCSVLWRGHVSALVPNCDLGQRYGDEFRRYLLGDAPFPKGAAVVLFFLEDGPGTRRARVSRAFTTPQSHRWRSFHTHRVVICGFQFEFAVGQAIDDAYRNFCLVRGKHRAIILWPSDSVVDWFGISVRGTSD
jgi:hypothetical protein